MIVTMLLMYMMVFFINALPGAIEQFIVTPHKRRYSSALITSVIHVDYNCS